MHKKNPTQTQPKTPNTKKTSFTFGEITRYLGDLREEVCPCQEPPEIAAGGVLRHLFSKMPEMQKPSLSSFCVHPVLKCEAEHLVCRRTFFSASREIAHAGGEATIQPFQVQYSPQCSTQMPQTLGASRGLQEKPPPTHKDIRLATSTGLANRDINHHLPPFQKGQRDWCPKIRQKPPLLSPHPEVRLQVSRQKVACLSLYFPFLLPA